MRYDDWLGVEDGIRRPPAGDPVDEESLGWVGNLRDLKDTSEGAVERLCGRA